MARRGRKLGYRTPKSLEVWGRLEQLFLLGYSSYRSHKIMAEEGLHCSRQTVSRFWKEIRAKHSNAA